MPHHIAVNRDNLEPGQDPPGFIETEDYVELDGALRRMQHGCRWHLMFAASARAQCSVGAGSAPC